MALTSVLPLLVLVVSAGGSVGPSSNSSLCSESRECLEYELLCKTDEYEVRHYSPTLWVSTDAEAYFMGVGAAMAFRRLFQYITGANEGGYQMDMTAPVLVKIPEETRMWEPAIYTLSFPLPQAYQEKPPQPTHDKLYFTEMPDMDVYVRSYGGWMLSVTSRLQAHQLTKELDRVGASYNHTHHYGVGYDSPLKLLNRHNEVWYLSKGKPVCTDPQEPTPPHPSRLRVDDPPSEAPRFSRLHGDDPASEAPDSSRLQADDPASEAPDSSRLLADDPASEAPDSSRLQADDPASEAPDSSRLQTEDPASEALDSSRLQADDPASEAPDSSRLQADDPASEAPDSSRLQANDPASEAPDSSRLQADDPASEAHDSSRLQADDPASEAPDSSRLQADDPASPATSNTSSPVDSGVPTAVLTPTSAPSNPSATTGDNSTSSNSSETGSTTVVLSQATSSFSEESTPSPLEESTQTNSSTSELSPQSTSMKSTDSVHNPASPSAHVPLELTPSPSDPSLGAGHSENPPSTPFEPREPHSDAH